MAQKRRLCSPATIQRPTFGAIVTIESAPSAVVKNKIKLSARKNQANYQLHCDKDSIILRFPDENYDLIAPIENHSQDTLKKLKRVLKHISRWTYIKGLNRSNSTFRQSDIEFRLSQDGQLLKPKSKEHFYLKSHYAQKSAQDKTPVGYFKMALK